MLSLRLSISSNGAVKLQIADSSIKAELFPASLKNLTNLRYQFGTLKNQSLSLLRLKPILGMGTDGGLSNCFNASNII